MKKMKMLIFIMILILPIVGLVGAGNLSTAIIILGIAVILVFVASPLYAQFVWLGLAGIGFLAVFLALESYRLERIAIWRNPELYAKGYQTMQGLYAIGSGGLFGRGSGESIQKLGFVPEAQNDMIFAIVCVLTLLPMFILQGGKIKSIFNILSHPILLIILAGVAGYLIY